MCSIMGMVGEPARGQWRQTHRFLTNLFVASQIRGEDATGFVAVTRQTNGKGSGSVVTDKAPLAASDFVTRSAGWSRLRAARANVVLGHCRLSTSGSPSVNLNNHPHVTDDGRYHLVHNGIVPKHDVIADRHCLRLRSNCDSEVLLRLFETAPRPVDGLADCLRACDLVGGSMAVAVLDSKTRTVWLCRDSDRPLWLCRIKGQKPWYFASTPEIILAAMDWTYGRDAKRLVETILPLATGHPTALTPGGLLIAPFSSPVRYRSFGLTRESKGVEPRID
jgi:glucosamine 6-phosphate synthetase-like amidotransferase/phosphosugar isomerase protein